MKSFIPVMAALLGAAGVSTAHAAVSAGDAAKLGTTLTPVGAEKAASADGTIPAWTGGMTGKKEDYYIAGRRPDPFAADKPLFSISASNMAQYADKLSEGVKALFAKYPQTFRIDVYKTLRTAAMPQYIYDEARKNATTTTITEKDGERFPQNFAGGIPFPIPQNGMELIWNHLLRWDGVAHRETDEGVLVTSEGKRVLTYTALEQYYRPYLDPKFNPDQWDGNYLLLKDINSGPPIRTGEGIVYHGNIDSANERAWVYLTGQRRVRMLPNACCDIPSPASAGVVSFDEYYTFTGSPRRFDWKILGKKEIYIPYNSNRTITPKSYEAVMSDHHMNPDSMRWELHRVWVLEATLREGQRHVAPRSTYYIDEDTWVGMLGERYDATNALWKMMWTVPAAMPDVPGELPTACGFNDLISGAWFLATIPNAYDQQFEHLPSMPVGEFAPDTLSGEGVR